MTEIVRPDAVPKPVPVAPTLSFSLNDGTVEPIEAPPSCARGTCTCMQGAPDLGERSLSSREQGREQGTSPPFPTRCASTSFARLSALMIGKGTPVDVVGMEAQGVGTGVGGREAQGFWTGRET